MPVYSTSDRAHRVQNLLKCLSQATAEVRTSYPLRQLLHLIRYAGNRLNMQGSLNCKVAHSPETIRAVMARYAVALKINDKLMQVLDTKTFHDHGSKLIHFVVAMCARPSCPSAAFCVCVAVLLFCCPLIQYLVVATRPSHCGRLARFFSLSLLLLC